MRFRSSVVGGFQVFAVAGVHTVSFAVTASSDARSGLLGFAVERIDEATRKRKTMPGFKVFRSIIPHPDVHTQVSTWDHPVQSLVWDDFTTDPDAHYEYIFHPLGGTPKNLDRSTPTISIRVRTEELFSNNTHDVFFNRGVASSQAYQRRFGNATPDDLPPAQKQDALDWLSRELDDALLAFIAAARAGDSLLCCFYEFRYQPVANALAAARTKGVTVKIIVDAKVNEYTDKQGNVHESFPRVENLKTIKNAGLPASAILKRDANKADIQHNKFMILLKGARAKPAEVWTGSTNISLGGITGQTNVGHWVRSAPVASAFKRYWDLLATNPGSTGSDASADRKRKADYRAAVEALSPSPSAVAKIPAGETAVFSPRSTLDVLDLYVQLVDSAKDSAAVTLAFGVNELFKDQLMDNTDQSGIVFLLLEKKDQPDARSTKPFVRINASNNVYKAWGSYIEDPVYQWARETNARALGLNTHVSYIHSKFLLRDPLSDDPIVVTGSANFSSASTTDNDENMLVIRGDRRAADIYFTEFNRLFNHYYFRSVLEDTKRESATDRDASLFLAEDSADWLQKYRPGTLRTKRVAMYARMQGFTTP